MNFTCDVCGREVFSCTFVNGMKFCAKCYQETFGETDKDRKIADLEAKLTESEKKAYSRGHSQRDIANEIKLNALREDVANKEKRIVKLKQQLADKDKEIEYQESMKILAVENQNKNIIEQLKKVKEFVSRQLFITTKGCSDLDEAEAKGCNELREEIIKEIDNQINELKGE